jgi:hypothetical protein
MGIFRGFKDTKAMIRVPRIQLQTDSAMSPSTAPRAAGFMPRPARTGGGDAPSDDALTPIEGVTLDCYAAIVRGIAAYNYDQSMLPGIAAEHGIDVDAWNRVHEGWNGRIQMDAAVARRFSDIYHCAQ